MQLFFLTEDTLVVDTLILLLTVKFRYQTLIKVNFAKIEKLLS
jgi:hypothetical protein